MKKKIMIPAAIAACIVLCATVWQQNETVKETPMPSKVPAVTDLQPILPEPDELAMPAITEKEPAKGPDAEPIHEVSTEDLFAPAPEIEQRVEPEPELPVQVDSKPTTEPISKVIPAQGSTELQSRDMVYVPGFGWLESQGEGTVIYDDIMYENGNKVGSMG